AGSIQAIILHQELILEGIAYPAMHRHYLRLGGDVRVSFRPQRAFIDCSQFGQHFRTAAFELLEDWAEQKAFRCKGMSPAIQSRFNPEFRYPKAFFRQKLRLDKCRTKIADFQ